MPDTNRKSTEERLASVGNSAMSSIRAFAAAINCDYGRLDQVAGEFDEWRDECVNESEPDNGGDGPINPKTISVKDWPSENAKELAELLQAADCNGSPCGGFEEACMRAVKSALSIEFRSGWERSWDQESIQPAEARILITTGGPAVQIIVEIDCSEPTSATLQVRDCGSPWTDVRTTSDDDDDLMTYVRCFCFYV